MRAGELIEKLLYDDPDDPDALLLFAHAMVDASHPAVARMALHRMTERRPDWRVQQALGAAELYMQRYPQAQKHLDKAIAEKPNETSLLLYMASLHLEQGYIAEGKRWAERALEVEPDSWRARMHLGVALLHQREFGRGWDEYHYGLGRQKWRAMHDYNLPEWKGEPDARVVLYGEQGIGDQIVWLSAAPDMPVHTINCYPKLEGLMRRTFPKVVVHGQQFTEPVTFSLEGATHQSSMASAQRWVRRNASDYPGLFYLKACPERRLQWRATLDALSDRPKIGLAWTGGDPYSAGSRSRNIPLDVWAKAGLWGLDADIISLEYRDRSDELAAFGEAHPDKPIYSYARATRTDDLDDFAALVANLDCVFCVPTTAYHVAGALGIPARVVVHETPHYHEGIAGRCPYWHSVRFYRRSKYGTEGAIKRVLEDW